MVKDKIAEYLHKNGIKQKFIADQADMTQASISGVVSGKRDLEVEEYVRICDALNVPYDYFMRTL